MKLQAPEHTFGVELKDVAYEVGKPEIEFFSNLPKLTTAEYRKLFTDENGDISDLCPFLPEDKIDRDAVFEKAQSDEYKKSSHQTEALGNRTRSSYVRDV